MITAQRCREIAELFSDGDSFAGADAESGLLPAHRETARNVLRLHADIVTLARLAESLLTGGLEVIDAAPLSRVRYPPPHLKVIG